MAYKFKIFAFNVGTNTAYKFKIFAVNVTFHGHYTHVCTVPKLLAQIQKTK